MCSDCSRGWANVGTIFSELKHLGSTALDFVVVAVDAGTDVSNIIVIVYHPTGAVRSTNTLGTSTDTVAGTDVYLLDTATSDTFSGLHQNDDAALVVDDDVTHFISLNAPLSATGGPGSGMISTSIATTSAGESLENTDGSTYTIQSAPTGGTVPCFVSGTLVMTEQGEVTVEKLRAGDIIASLDDGFQPLLWVGDFNMSPQKAAQTSACPIAIAKNSFGTGLPGRDLQVSPNHLVMLDQTLCEVLFAQREVLVSAKGLLGLAGGAPVVPTRAVRYHHLLLEMHQIIEANGISSESLYPGEQTTLGMTFKSHAAIAEALALVSTHTGRCADAARMVLRAFEVQALVKALAQRPCAAGDAEAA